jgi:hypothetical protein
MKRALAVALVATLGVLVYQAPALAHIYPPPGSPVYCGHDFALEVDEDAPEQNFQVFVWFDSHWTENVGGQMIHRHRYLHTGSVVSNPVYEQHYTTRGCGVY